MIPPVLAASAASSAMSILSSIASTASDKSSGSSESSGTSGTTGTNGTSGTGATRRNDALGQQEFLSLLVAQLQNQDPLNPLDSADFSAQLAQFSSLEQLMQINQRLTDLGEDDPSAPSFDPVGLLGRDVTAKGNAVDVTGGESSALEYTLAEAGTVSVEVRSASGTLISSADLGQIGAGTHVLDLDDVSAVADLADGDYQVSVKVKTGDAAPAAVDTRIIGTVTGVDLTSNPPTVRIGDLEIPLGDVREVRAAAAAA
jgi:flagellar basal-body rod modification protein FlgD